MLVLITLFFWRSVRSCNTDGDAEKHYQCCHFFFHIVAVLISDINIG